jgi:hypothetical protein
VGLGLIQVFTLEAQVVEGLLYMSSPFCSGYFGDWVLITFCPGWPQTEILLISAFKVTRITGISHWCPAQLFLKRRGRGGIFLKTISLKKGLREAFPKCSQYFRIIWLLTLATLK